MNNVIPHRDGNVIYLGFALCQRQKRFAENGQADKSSAEIIQLNSRRALKKAATP